MDKKDKKQIRHTHNTAAGLEDAIAVLLDVIHVIRETLQYAEARIRKALEILKITRRGPHSYDAEKPAGPRRIRKR